MGVESRVAKATAIATVLIVTSGFGLRLKERADRNRKVRELAEDSNRSGEAGVVSIKGKFLLEPKPI